MNRILSNTLRIAAALLLAGFLGPAATTQAQEVVVGRHTASWSSFGALGISGFACDCTLNWKDDTATWTFRGEPVIRTVAPGGPASGKLREGDVIVSIDGLLITTRAAGERVANLREGQNVVLAVRRNGRVQEVAILAEEDMAGPAVPMTPPMAPTIAPPVRAPRSPAAPTPTAPMTPPTPPAPPSSWFGFGITCHNCEHTQQNEAVIDRKEAELRNLLGRSDRGSPQALELRQQLEELRKNGSVWKFSEYPTVYSVDSDSPAEEAGLRRGDVLTMIDGVSLLTEDGGRRFGATEPGQTVVWTYRRGGETQTAKVTAAEVPDNYLQPRLAEMRSALDRLRSTESGRRDVELARLRQDLERIETTRPTLARAPEAQHLRFAGMVGNTNVEVRGLSSVDVSYDNSTGELLIHTTDATIRVKAPKD